MRCAIYTRKSAEEAENSQLSTIENQRDLCEKYVASQAGEGWVALSARYDDSGWSGGTLKRPGLEQLLADVDAGLVDRIVVYKIDRLSRSLRDFLNLVDRLERAGAGVVSVTQSFDTATSMGRLTLNILLSFAQFERELTGERSRDWKAGARARGLWTSGPPPFGYSLADLHLEVHPERAAIVRLVYRHFVKLRSFAQVAAALNAAGHRNRKDRPFEGRLIKAIVSSRLYRGELPHAGGFLPGTHKAIVGEALWRRAQTVLTEIGAKPHRW